MTSRVSTANMDTLTSFSNPQPTYNQPLRRGTWTAEEEQYVAALIEEFKHGHLPLKEGMSLRCFLSKMLKCNPKRVSKKFEGSNYNGKQLYEQSDKELDPEEAQLRRVKLQELEDRFEHSVTALKSAEESRRTGLMDQALAGPMNLYPQRSSYPMGATGLRGCPPGMFNSEANWLRGSLAMPPTRHVTPYGMGMGMNAIPGLAGAFDPALFHGGVVDPMGPTAGLMHPAALRRMSEYGRIPTAAIDLCGDSAMLSKKYPQETSAPPDYHERNMNDTVGGYVGPSRGTIRGAAAARGMPPGYQATLPEVSTMSDLSSSSTSSAAGSGPSPGLAPLRSDRSSLPAHLSHLEAKDNMQEPLSEAEQEQLHETTTRRRLMDLLSQPTSRQTKRPSMEASSSSEDGKRRRMY